MEPLYRSLQCMTTLTYLALLTHAVHKEPRECSNDPGGAYYCLRVPSPSKLPQFALTSACGGQSAAAVQAISGSGVQYTC